VRRYNQPGENEVKNMSIIPSSEAGGQLLQKEHIFDWKKAQTVSEPIKL
jgi:hypothetical protein